MEDALSSKAAGPFCVPTGFRGEFLCLHLSPALAAVSAPDLGHVNSIPKACFREQVARQFLSVCVSELSPELV